jgi:predicted XRE-type DNA-binding protein
MSDFVRGKIDLFSIDTLVEMLASAGMPILRTKSAFPPGTVCV